MMDCGEFDGGLDETADFSRLAIAFSLYDLMSLRMLTIFLVPFETRGGLIEKLRVLEGK